MYQYSKWKLFFYSFINVYTVTGCSMVTLKIRKRDFEMSVSHKTNTMFSPINGCVSFLIIFWLPTIQKLPLMNWYLKYNFIHNVQPQLFPWLQTLPTLCIYSLPQKEESKPEMDALLELAFLSAIVWKLCWFAA